MGLGYYCLNDGQVGNPVRQKQLHTYTDYRRWEEDSCNEATTERQMLHYNFFWKYLINSSVQILLTSSWERVWVVSALQ